MSISTNVVNIPSHSMSAITLEKVIVNADLANLSSVEKVQYIKSVCDSLGLNTLTKPIQLIRFQGKEIMYFSKDATEQLRKINHVSIDKVESKFVNEHLYVVTAMASIGNRTDSSTGAVCITGLKGDNLSNALMKAETKAKRRVTLSICGLGHLDESEIESMHGHEKVNIIEEDINDHIEEINQCSDIEELKRVFSRNYKYWLTAGDNENIKKIIDAKENKKSLFENMEI